MPFDRTVPRTLRVFMACPGDVQDEKQRLIRAIGSLQSEAAARGIRAVGRGCAHSCGARQDPYGSAQSRLFSRVGGKDPFTILMPPADNIAGRHFARAAYRENRRMGIPETRRLFPSPSTPNSSSCLTGCGTPSCWRTSVQKIRKRRAQRINRSSESRFRVFSRCEMI